MFVNSGNWIEEFRHNIPMTINDGIQLQNLIRRKDTEVDAKQELIDITVDNIEMRIIVGVVDYLVNIRFSIMEYGVEHAFLYNLNTKHTDLIIFPIDGEYFTRDTSSSVYIEDDVIKLTNDHDLFISKIRRIFFKSDLLGKDIKIML